MLRPVHFTLKSLTFDSMRRRLPRARLHLWRAAALSLTAALLLTSVPPSAAASASADLARPAAWFSPLAETSLSGILKLVGAGREQPVESVMPQQKRARPERKPAKNPLTREEKEQKVAALQVNPSGEVSLRSREPMVFAAVPVDEQGNAVHGLTATWETSDKQVVFIARDGRAVAGHPGVATVTASAGNKKEIVRVRVFEGTDERFGGKKKDTSRRPRKAEQKGGARAGDTAVFRKASWSPDSPKPRSRANRPAGARFVKTSAAAAAAPMPLPPPEYDPLPDDETGSLYRPSNTVGTPPGRRTPGALTPPAAMDGTEMPGSQNFSFDVPVANLMGRQMGVELAMTYNSRVWHKSTDPWDGTTYLTYDVDSGWPAPGFRLGYGHIEDQGSYGFTLIDHDGTRHQLVKTSTNYYDYNYKTVDGTFINFYGGRGWGSLTDADGTRIDYGAAGNGYRSYPTRITDRNGNYILISYVGGVGPRISSVQDTMGRYVRFYYSGNDLVAVTTPGYAGGGERQTVRFYYEDIAVNGNFTVYATAPPSVRAIRFVYDPGTQTGFRYDYSPYGMIRQVVQLRGMGVNYMGLDATGAVTNQGQVASTTLYNYPDAPASLSDVPTYTTRTDDWAGRTSGMPGTGAAPFHQFAVDQANGISTVTAPDGSVTETHTIVAPGQWNDGLVSQTVVRHSAGGAVLGRTTTEWETDASGQNYRPRQLQVFNDAGQSRTTVYTYTSFNNVAVESVRGFDGAEVRRVETDYEARPEWVNRRLLRLPTSVRVYAGGASTPTSRVDYAYDGPGSSLTPRGDIIMHDPAFDPFAPTTEDCYWECVDWYEWGGCRYEYVCYSYNPYDPSTDKRGNVTSVTSYADAASLGGPTTYTTAYDIAGNAVSESTDCCRQKTYNYSKAYEYAYPSSQTRGTSPLLTTSVSYDFNTGLLRTTTDENNLTLTFHYYPESLRLYRAESPDGGFNQIEYFDGLYPDPDASRMHSAIRTTFRLDASRNADTWEFYDGRGAVARKFGIHDPARGHMGTTDIEYDAQGRVLRTSNPYYSPGGSGYPVNPAGLWTTNTYDKLGSITTVTLPDNTVMTSSYSGNTTVVTDQTGKSRRQVSDALGRLVRLDEPDDSGNLGPAHAPTQPTYYDYNATDNVVHIAQGAQHRYFKYDSLGRLTHERLVEQEAPHYAYDPQTNNHYWSRRVVYNAHGHVTDAYNAQGVHTHIDYDGLNRISQITYSDGTPAANFYYDQARPGYYNQGRLTQVTTAATGSAPATSLDKDYDSQGRVVAQRQTVGGSTYSTAYGYNHAGRLVSETYPSGRTVSFAYDSTARLSAVSDQYRTYASGFVYAPHGGLTSETFGNGAVHSVAYNNRLQIAQIALHVAGAERQRYDYAYGEVDQNTGAVDASKNNGQIARLESFIGGAKQWQQRFTYDKIGRLAQASEFRGDNGAQVYRLNYAYDRYGNRYQYASQNQNNPVPYAPVEAGDINQNNNRFTNGVSYDPVGRITFDYKFRGMQYHYDANGRVRYTARTDGSGGTSSAFDGAGQRVQTVSNGQVQHYVYDAFGQLISEYSQGVLDRENIYRDGKLLATDEQPRACAVSIEQFVRNFFLGALARQPSLSELQYWMDRLGQAQAQGFAPLLGEAQRFGEQLFSSAEYVARNRPDRDYVYDLYWGYLQRGPDQGGWDHWTSVVPSSGRHNVRLGFAYSAEFHNKVASICPSGGAGGGVRYVMLDHLGSSRVVLDANATVLARRDYLPFGEEIWAGVGQRTTSQGFGVTDRIRQRFAGAERDDASGLGHTLWRKYDNVSGRFTSPDPAVGSINPADPQSLNRYSYVENDPLNATDPLGLMTCFGYHVFLLTVLDGRVIGVEYLGFLPVFCWDDSPVPIGDTTGGGIGPGGSPGNGPRLAPLTGKDKKNYDKSKDKARERLKSEQCRRFLLDHGINPDDALAALEMQRAYYGPKSEISRFDAGTVDLNDPDVQNLKRNDPARYNSIMNGPVKNDFDSAGRLRAETGLFPGGVFGATVSDRSTVFFRGSGLVPETIVHEALHSLTGLGDADLAKKLGVTVSPGNTSPISDALKKNGCA